MKSDAPLGISLKGYFEPFLSKDMLNIFLILTIYFQTAVLETLQYSDMTLAVLLRFGSGNTWPNSELKF
jgi:hypothetical protein